MWSFSRASVQHEQTVSLLQGEQCQPVPAAHFHAGLHSHIALHEKHLLDFCTLGGICSVWGSEGWYAAVKRMRRMVPFPGNPSILASGFSW